MSSESELVCSFQYPQRPSLFCPDGDYLTELVLKCPRSRLGVRPDISLDKQVQELRTNKAMLNKIFFNVFVCLQRDLLQNERVEQIQRTILERMKGYRQKGRVELKPDALRLLAGREGFQKSMERMALALDDYLKSNEQVVDTVSIQAFNDTELQRTTLEVILSVPVTGVDAMLSFRERLCDYLDSALSDDDKIRITTTVERTP